MPDWFVYQRDVFPSTMDPDALGTMLVPEYDTHNNNVVYRDPDTPAMNGLRRVKSYWGVDPNIVQYDIVVHGGATGEVLTVHWFPRTERFAFKNLNNGFSFENPTQQLCLYVARDAHDDTNHATLMRYDPVTHTYTTMVGVVVGIRVHTLALFAPGRASWFAEQVTAKTSSSVVLPSRHVQPPRAPHQPPPVVLHAPDGRSGERVTSPTPFLSHTTPDDTAGDLAHYHHALRHTTATTRDNGGTNVGANVGANVCNESSESLTFSTPSSSVASTHHNEPTAASTITHPTTSPRTPLLPTAAQEVANRNKLL